MPAIILSDNGATSGSAGLKTSGGNDGVLQLQTTTSGGTPTTAISISNTQVVTYTNQPTYTGGTANGVLYLNGSKAVTSGTALVFDGTNLLVGTTTATGTLSLVNAQSTAANNTTTGAIFSALSPNSGILMRNRGNSAGIGGSAYSTQLFTDSGAGNFEIYNIAASYGLVFGTAATERMRLDSAGNLGLRVTPSGWSSATPTFQIGAFGVVTAHTSANYCNVGTNYYFNGSNNVYIGTGSATLYSQNSGAHAWYVAGSGTAGNTVSFSQSMTLDSSGRLGIGNTSPNRKLYVQSDDSSTGGNVVGVRNSNTTAGAFVNFIAGGSNAPSIGAKNNDIVFTADGYSGTELARINSGGDWTFPFGWLKNFSAGGTTSCLGIGTGDTGFMFIPIAAAPARIIPRNFAGTGADNAIDLGDAGSRYKTIYAATGTINTSDAREKTAVTPLTTDELTAASQIAASVGTYQWLQAVEEKGAAARHHAGLTVQRAIEIMEANNLNPFDYGFICYDSWQTEEYEGVVIREAGDRYSFRMDELSLFIARGQQAIIETLTNRITALEQT